MALTLRTARCMTAVVALAALAAFGAARANHFILPCGDVCTDPHWAPTGSLNVARSFHSATLLQDGRVLVAGGRGFGVLDSAELYDPATGTWSLTGRMSMPRVGHTATLLSDGRVLVAGGDTSEAPATFGRTGTAELYDPSTGLWQPTGSMTAVRSGHSATLLQDGRVLVAGGFNSNTLGSAELYDPITNTWSATGTLNVSRYWHSATLLQDGRVLVARGTNDGDLTSTLSSAELYDPLSGEWSLVADDPGWGSVSHTATLLPDGKVLVTGGNTGGIGGDGVLAVSEQFDPATETWTRGGDLLAPRYGHTATLLPSGDVLVSGGQSQVSHYPTLQYVTYGSTERFDPGTALWGSDANLNAARGGHTATLLSDGTVLVAGGSDLGPDYTEITLASAELYGVTAGPLGAQPLQSPPQSTTVAVEYYSLGWDDYFLTAFPDEIAALDFGASHFDASGAAWLRTGQRFNVYPFTGAPGPNSTVWRFLSRSFASGGSHFYTADVTERDALLAGAVWQLEGAAFSAPMPASDGTCPDGSIPVYRMYNDGIDGVPHHRLTTDIDVRAAMLARGWIPEGPGIGVAFCSPE